MAKLNLKQIEAFVQVADLKSFRRAAERLFTTQPNISARIAGMEESVAAKLFIRDGGNVRLTPKGEALLPHARSVLRATDVMLDATDDNSIFEGVLRLGVTEMVVHSWLGDFLNRLKQALPNVQIDLTVDLSTNISTSLHNRELDLALQSGPFSRQVSGQLDLGSYPMIWVGAPQMDVHKSILRSADIAQYPIITHARKTLPYQQMARHFEQVLDAPVQFFSSTNMAACLHMALNGLGVACLLEVMLRDYIKRGELKPVRYLWVPDDLHFYARYDTDSCSGYVAKAAAIAAEVANNWNHLQD